MGEPSGNRRLYPEKPCSLILLTFQASGTFKTVIRLLNFLFAFVTSSARTRLSLQLEVAALRHQLEVYQRQCRRPRIAAVDRLLWSCIARLWSDWKRAVFFVQPRTVTLWQKKRFRHYWRRLSANGTGGRPQIPTELQRLLKRMWKANPTWGSSRIVDELHKLGIDVAKSTVEKYKPHGGRAPSPTWRTFLALHWKDLVAVDFFVVPTATFKVLFVFLVLAHDRRQIVHFNVT